MDGLARFFRQWTLAQTGATHADRAAEVRQQALQLLREAVGLGNAREPRGKKPSRRGRGRGGRGRNRPTAEEGATTPETPGAMWRDAVRPGAMRLIWNACRVAVS